MPLKEIHKHTGSDQPKLKPSESLEGYPVLLEVPTYKGRQGEIVLHDNETDTRALYMYMNGAWYNVQSGTGFVDLTTDQNVGGVKTFMSIPVLPAVDPTADNEAVRKKYLDDNFVGLGEAVGFSASDVLQISADDQVTENTGFFVIRKEIILDWGGTIRVKFDLKSQLASWTARGTIHVNDIAIGTPRSLNTQSFITYTEDITVVPHDKVQLYIQGASGGPSNAIAENFRLYFDRAITNDYTINLN